MMAQILKIKNHRVKRQHRKVREQEARVADLDTRYQKENADFLAFRQQRLATEVDLFAKLQASPASMPEIEMFNEEMAGLAAKEKALADQLASLEMARVTAEDELKAARLDLIQVVRKEQKFERMTETVLAEKSRLSDLKDQQHEEELAHELYLNRGVANQ